MDRSRQRTPSAERHSSGITDDQCTISLRFGDGSIGTIVYTAEGNAGLPKEHFEAHADGKHDVFKTAKREKGFREEIARLRPGRGEGTAAGHGVRRN